MQEKVSTARRAIRRRVGRNVRRLRRLRGLSQEKLAELAGNTNKHVSLVEQGRVNVGLDYLSSMARALGVDVSDLLIDSRPGARGSRLVILSDRELRALEGLQAVVQAIRRANERSRGR